MKLIKDGVLQVKVGDTIVHRNERHELIEKLELQNKDVYPVSINRDGYTTEGRFLGDDVGSNWDIVAIIPATSPQGESVHTWNCSTTHSLPTDVAGSIVTPVYRMIDLLAQGVEFVKDSNDDVWTYKDNAFHLFIRGAFLCQTGVSNLQRVIFNEATIAENPEKPKRVVYNWVYKRTQGIMYNTTIHKYATEEEVRKDLDTETCYGIIQSIEKIEHSREEG